MDCEKHKLAQEKRAFANRIRQILWGISLDRDRDRLRQHADQLEYDADELERQSLAAPKTLKHGPPGQQKQTQVQQQQASEPKKR